MLSILLTCWEATIFPTRFSVFCDIFFQFHKPIEIKNMFILLALAHMYLFLWNVWWMIDLYLVCFRCSPQSVWSCTCECLTSCGGLSAWSTYWPGYGRDKWRMPGSFALYQVWFIGSYVTINSWEYPLTNTAKKQGNWKIKLPICLGN